LEVLAGDAAGLYRRGEFAVAEKSGDDAYFGLSLRGKDGALLAFRGQPQALEWLRSAGHLRSLPGSGMSAGTKMAVLIAFLAALFAFMYKTGLDLATDAVMRVLPPGVDRMLGGSVAASFAARQVRPEGAAARRALEKSREMVRSLRAGYPDSVRILIVRDTSTRNAYAFPGGTIVVFTGMLRMLDGQEEWMGLLAHEGAHLHLRHGTRRLVRSSLLGMATAFLTGDMTGAGSVLLDNAGALINLGYGRREEAEADDFALECLRSRGYAASGLAALFRKFLEYHELPGWAAFLSTHPAIRDRLAALEGAGEGGRGLLLNPAEWEALKHLGDPAAGRVAGGGKGI
jgi:Zn-dependent protease with chaperone function